MNFGQSNAGGNGGLPPFPGPTPHGNSSGQNGQTYAAQESMYGERLVHDTGDLAAAAMKGYRKQKTSESGEEVLRGFRSSGFAGLETYLPLLRSIFPLAVGGLIVFLIMRKST